VGKGAYLSCSFFLLQVYHVHPPPKSHTFPTNNSIISTFQHFNSKKICYLINFRNKFQFPFKKVFGDEFDEDEGNIQLKSATPRHTSKAIQEQFLDIYAPKLILLSLKPFTWFCSNDFAPQMYQSFFGIYIKRNLFPRLIESFSHF
jgi:hypothetical protein